MALYSRQPRRLLGQLSGDLFAVAWLVGCWFLGGAARRVVQMLAVPARQTADTAQQVAEQLGRAATRAGEVPGVGDRIGEPVGAAARSVADLVAGAQAQADSIERLAQLVGWAVFAVPVVGLLALWLPRRIGFVAESRAVRRLHDSGASVDLLALRAMSRQPLPVLAAVSADPAAGWRAGDATVISKLAEVELRRCGLRGSAPTPSGRVGAVGRPAGKDQRMAP